MSGKKRAGVALLNVELPAELKDALDKYCESHGTKIKWVVTQAIKEYLERHGGLDQKWRRVMQLLRERENALSDRAATQTINKDYSAREASFGQDNRARAPRQPPP
jgi:hypothetical protein